MDLTERLQNRIDVCESPRSPFPPSHSHSASRKIWFEPCPRWGARPIDRRPKGLAWVPEGRQPLTRNQAFGVPGDYLFWECPTTTSFGTSRTKFGRLSDLSKTEEVAFPLRRPCQAPILQSFSRLVAQMFRVARESNSGHHGMMQRGSATAGEWLISTTLLCDARQVRSARSRSPEARMANRSCEAFLATARSPSHGPAHTEREG
jgi:hypothetical protein